MTETPHADAIEQAVEQKMLGREVTDVKHKLTNVQTSLNKIGDIITARFEAMTASIAEIRKDMAVNQERVDGKIAAVEARLTGEMDKKIRESLVGVLTRAVAIVALVGGLATLARMVKFQ